MPFCHYSLHKVCLCKYAVLLSQSVSITEAAITGGDKSEHTQSACLQYTLSLLLQRVYIIHMTACVRNFGEKFSSSFNLSLYFPLFTLCIFYQSFFYFIAQLCNIYWSQKCDLRHFPWDISHFNQYICPIQLLNPLDTWISDQWCGAQPVLKVVFAPFVLEWNWRRKKNIFLGVKF